MSVQHKHLCLVIKPPLLLDKTHDPTYLLFKIILKKQTTHPPKIKTTPNKKRVEQIKSLIPISPW